MADIDDLTREMQKIRKKLDQIQDRIDEGDEGDGCEELQELIDDCTGLVDYADTKLEDLDLDGPDYEEMACDDHLYDIRGEKYTPLGMIDEIVQWREIVAQLLGVPVAYIDLGYVRANMPRVSA